MSDKIANKYRNGNSILSITNGEYYIVKTSKHNIETASGNVPTQYNLFKNGQSWALIMNIQKYKIIEELNKIYLVGNAAFDSLITTEKNNFKYLILDYETNIYYSYNTLEELDKKIIEDEKGWLVPNNYS